jgi:hypothetical protein
MSDLKRPGVIYFKGFLFLLAGAISGVILLLENPTPRTAFLLALCVWCFCRTYYFVFYVIEHYVDSEFRFSGLFDFVKYLLRSRTP